jgi:hypothetical protein
VYANITAFYAANPARERSCEADFGTWWMEWTDWPVWRVSWVSATGEIYAVRLDGGPRLDSPDALTATAGDPVGSVEVLGVIPADPDAEVPYEPVERLLAGWEDWCGELDSLLWVRERAAAAATATGIRS